MTFLQISHSCLLWVFSENLCLTMQFNIIALFKTPDCLHSTYHYLIYFISGSHNMMIRLAASSSPENLLEMKILSPRYMPTESEMWWIGANSGDSDACWSLKTIYLFIIFYKCFIIVYLSIRLIYINMHYMHIYFPQSASILKEEFMAVPFLRPAVKAFETMAGLEHVLHNCW